jgi:putative ABC transport system ATP-binding protein
MSLVEIRNVDKSFSREAQTVEVYNDLSIDFEEGSFTALMGPSGSGKSTLLNLVAGLDKPTAGTVRVAGAEVSSMSAGQLAAWRARTIGFVFQSYNLLPFKNAAENVALPLYYQGVGRRERNRRAEEILDMVGLSDRRTFMPNQLSGGQKQRVAIARALVCKPKVILADEPTGALDSQTTQEIMELLKDIHRRGNTLIIVTHEQDIADQCERQIFLRDGVVKSTAEVA